MTVNDQLDQAAADIDDALGHLQDAQAVIAALRAAQGTGGGTTTGGTGGGTTTGGTGGSTGTGGTADGVPPFFTSADWLWRSIVDSPVLDQNSAAWGSMLGNSNHVADTGEYGVAMYDVTDPSVHRAAVPLSTRWGASSIAGVPIPASIKVATGGDKGLAIIDHAGGMVYNFWVAQPSGGGLKAEAGSAMPITSDGRETGGFTSTGSCLARAGAVVRLSEVAEGVIPHALFFASQFVQKTVFRFPATKTDGSNMKGASNPIPEGARVQLDPAIDLTKISGITAFELAVGRALQVYGAYCGDNGGAGMAFSCELGDYSRWGASGDYYGMPHLPWGHLRVLRQWDGK